MNFLKQNKKLIFFLILPIVLIFRNFLIKGPTIWGDAPYFFKEGLAELTFPMSAQISRGNPFGGVNNFLWIYPLMYIYGFLGKYLNLGNDIIIRILFYLPSIVFSVIGSILLAKKFKFSKKVQFFTALIYLINTYYLLLVDGGQVGIVLSYGIFPLATVCFLNFLELPSVFTFLISLLTLQLLTIADFRIAAICIFFSFLIDSRKNFKSLIYLLVSLVAINSYWLIPALKISQPEVSSASSLQLVSLLNPFFLFQPHWPGNIFGKVNPPNFYFVGLPFLIFLPLLLKKANKTLLKFYLILLLFIFLSKGETYPAGFFYRFFINKIPFGSVFRDSTKFFIPLVLISGIFIGKSVEIIKSKLFAFLVFIYILFLINPVLIGKMNGILGKIPNTSNFSNLYEYVSQKEGFFRTAYFPEQSPFTFHTEEKQALNAKDLTNFRPFASINVGTGDRFNFINNNEYLDWFDILGIKYLIFSGNPRQPVLDKSDQKDWDRLLNLVKNNKNLEKINIGTNLPIFQTKSSKQHLYGVSKMYLVIGPDDIYQRIRKVNKNFLIGNQGFLFVEDGKLNLEELTNLPDKSLNLIFDDKGITDLKMGFLKSSFVNPDMSTTSQWAIRRPEDYLNWKYELLINKIDTHDFDYNLGVAFSSQPSEEIKFNVSTSSSGEYYLLVRNMSAENSQDLKWEIENYQGSIKNTKSKNFQWSEVGPLKLKAGQYTLTFKNTKGFQVLNTFVLVNKKDLEEALSKANNLVNRFEKIDLTKTDIDKINNINTLFQSSWVKINFTKIDSENYRIENPKNNFWIIFSDKFEKNWKVKTMSDYIDPLPVYSMLNAYYINNTKSELNLIYTGQKYVDQGIYLSIVSSLIILVILGFIFLRNKKRFKKAK
ncbi:MAG: hypothetical protein HY044_03055 [Candidatus Woesebacteria bacterium]|nr:MAG: hypothetical protein HY044_03055 [Candidatus Woesebacteria bacterium]